MEDAIYANVECVKPIDPGPSPYQPGPTHSGRRSLRAAVLCLGLWSVVLLAGLISLTVYSAELSAFKVKLIERLQASDQELSSLTEERDRLNASLIDTSKERELLNASLIDTSKERDRLNASLIDTSKERDRLNASLIDTSKERDLLKSSLIDTTNEMNKLRGTSPAVWKRFQRGSYLLSTESGSWEKGRVYCWARGADLVVIDSAEEQEFLYSFIEQRIWAWIGLTDRNEEGTWTWINGAPLSLQYWRSGQPDNGGGNPAYGEEDCAHTGHGETYKTWNDMSCYKDLRWICEKTV